MYFLISSNSEIGILFPVILILYVTKSSMKNLDDAYFTLK